MFLLQLLGNRQRLPIHHFCLPHLALLVEYGSQIVQQRRDIHIFVTGQLFLHGQRLALERFGFRPFALRRKHISEEAEVINDVPVFVAE